MKKSFSFILGTLQAFTAIGAIPAGYAYLMDPTGAKMGATPELLANSPLDSFFIPGLFLLLINGLANLIAAFLSFSRSRYAGIAGVFLGITLILWIVIQVWWISLSSILQPIFLVIGIINAWLGWKIMNSGINAKEVQNQSPIK